MEQPGEQEPAAGVRDACPPGRWPGVPVG